MEKLEQEYADDVGAYRAAMIEKLGSDEVFWNQVVENNETFFTELAEAYGVDFSNYQSLAEAKAAIDEKLIQSLSGAWGEYFGTIIDANTGMMEISAKLAPEEESAEYLSAYAELYKLKEARNKLVETSKLEVDIPDFGGIGKKDDGSGSGSGSGSDPKEEEIDWIERKKEVLQRLHDIQEKIASDETESYAERQKALDDLINIDRQRAEFSNNAASQYEKAWLEASKNLSEEDKTFIKEGGDVVKKYNAQELLKDGKVDSLEAGEQYIEDLGKSQELYNKMVESQQEEKDNQKKLIEDQKRKIQLVRDQIAAQQDLNDAITDQINSQRELDEANGEYIGRAHYEDLISQSKEKELLIQKDINELQNNLELAEESAERDKILAEIESCKNELIQCQAEQAELNDTILRLPIERLQMFRDLYAQIIEDMDNYRSIQEKMGLNPTKEELQTYIDLYAESIDSSLEQQAKLKDLLKNYSYGSDKFNETSEEIQNLDNEISNLIASQIELNNEMLQIPITEMSEQIDKIGNVKTALQNSIAEDNAKGLQTTVSQYADLHSLTLQQLNLYARQKEELTKLLDVYDEESEYYKETEQQIFDIENEMSNLVQETYQWNQELLNIPIENLEKVNENLSNYSSILGDILSDYDSALSGVNTLIDNEIEGVQDVLDALNQQNEALQIQRNLEQSLYNLRRAEEQKNVAVIRNGEKVYESNQDDLRSAHQEFADAQYDKMVYDLEQQIEALENIKDKWQEIIDKIEEAKNLQAAEDLFGSGWQDSVLADSADLRDLFGSLYESTYNEKEAIDKQIVSNERMIQMMNELISRYRDGSITYEEALSGINSMTDSADGNYTAIEMLNGMMSLDNISGLKDISEATQVSVDETVDLLKQYMEIAESNKESVKHFETSLEGMSQNVTESVESFKKSAESLQIYIDAYKANSEAINEYTKTWDEMKRLIAEQVEALKAAAEALEKQEKTSTSSSKPSSSGSSSSSKSDSGGGTYYSAGGKSYHESTGTPAEIIGSHGTDKEKESYRDYRYDLIDAKREQNGEGWYEAAKAQLDEELKKAGIPTKYHTGILKGPVGFTPLSNDSIYQFAKRIATNPLKADEVAAILQKGEFVTQPEQMSNIMRNNQMIGQMAAEQATNAIGRVSTNAQAFSFSIGEVHLHEVQNADEFAKALSQTFETSMQQNFSKIFKH
jgi:tetratricopeptide (TPR) repeat protein